MFGTKNGKIEKHLFFSLNVAAQVIIDIQKKDYERAKGHAKQVFEALETLQILHNKMVDIIKELETFE